MANHQQDYCRQSRQEKQDHQQRYGYQGHQGLNRLHAYVLVGSMTLLLAFSVSLLLGWPLWLCLGIVAVILLTSVASLPSGWTLKAYNARLLDWKEVPELYRLVQLLSQRAGLQYVPELYWIPSGTLNAFSVGDQSRSGIGITNGLLNSLSHRELLGVLAHEVSHIAHNDTRLMALADLISRVTYMMALAGSLLVVLLLPMALMGVIHFSPLAVIFLLITPWISGLLQLKLSRTREFAADLKAAHLTGDPMGLASALAKIDLGGRKGWRRLFVGYQQPQPSLLRSHPATKERVRALQQLELPEIESISQELQHWSELPDHHVGIRNPRHYLFIGIWR